jgi:DNA-binding transcriptional LysR family regulator
VTNRVSPATVFRVPELRHLRYFVAVAEELNFTRAARRLRMAQPPLSVAIRQLEQEMGVSLLARTSHEVRLTEAGEVFLEGARRTLAESDAAIASAQRAGAGEIGRLRIGYSWSARFEVLPTLGRAFAAQRPAVSLVAEETWNARMAGRLRSGALDLAVAICPELSSELLQQRLCSERVVALLPDSHRLAGQQDLALAALADEEFLVFPRELAPRLYDFLVGLCRSAGFEPRHHDESFHTLWTLGGTATASIALVPESVARGLPEGTMAAVLSDPMAWIETHMVWRRDNRSPTVAGFVEVGRATFEGR